MRFMQEKESQIAMSVISRLKSALNISSDFELAPLLGVKPNTISTWKKRGIGDYNSIFALCEEHSFNIHYVITGVGSIEILINEDSTKRHPPPLELHERIIELQQQLIEKLNYISEIEAQLKNNNRGNASIRTAKRA